MKKLILAMVVASAMVMGVCADGADESRCRHCNSRMYGPGCSHSPSGRHER